MLKKDIYIQLQNLKLKYRNDLERNHYKRSSIVSYIYDISIFIEYLAENSNLEKLADIEFSEINDFFEYLRLERMNSKRTLLRKYNTINNFLNFCVHENAIKKNPLSQMEKPEYDPLKVTNPDEEALNKLIINAITQETLTDRQKALSQYYSLRDIAIISLLLTTGIGVGELTQIDLDDIDYKMNRINLKNNKIINLNKSTQKYIQEYVESERQSYDDSLRALFISSRGVRTRLTVRSVQRIIKKYSTNIDMKISPQSLKRTYFDTYNGRLNHFKDELSLQLSNELEKIVINHN